MVVESTSFTAFIAALFISILPYCSAESVYCVTPTASSCSSCPHNSTHCATLSEYAQEAKFYFCNCDISVKSMVTWQEHHSGVGVKIKFGFLCILRECSTVSWIVRAGWAGAGSGCDTVHTLSRAVREDANEQCCYKSSEWCGLNNHGLKWLQKSTLVGYWSTMMY